VEISHFKIAAPYGKARPEEMLALVEKARREGLDVTADQYPYDAGSTRISILLPGEFATSDSIKDEYKTKEGRKKVREAILDTFSYLPPEKTLVTMYTGREEYEGKNISEIAEMMGKDPADAYVEMVCEETSPTGVFFLMDMKTVRALMPHEYIITASDGWTVPKGMTKPHPRTYGTFPRKLRTFVLEEKIMSLPAAIRSMTSLPAEKFRIKGRGRIAVDNFADIAVIDLKTIAGPAEYLAPHRYATGVRHLFVNGVLSIENGVATGDRGGRATRRA
jgi:N-acyl-D-amino-acid deacylase